jgi:membrane-associated protein
VTSLEQVATALAETVSRTGHLAPGILFLATFIEYVFPPFPGDLLVVLGAWYAAQGELSWFLAFASVTAGAVAGAWLDHRVGRYLAPRLDRRAARRGSRSAERLARFVTSYQRWGGLLLVANRFLPGVRAFIFVGAGAAGVPLRKTLLLGGISAALWNAVLLAAGGLLAENVEELVALVDRYTRLAWAALIAVALLVIAAGAWRRRVARSDRPAPESR